MPFSIVRKKNNKDGYIKIKTSVWYHKGRWSVNIWKIQQAKDSFPEHIKSSKKLIQKRMDKAYEQTFKFTEEIQTSNKYKKSSTSQIVKEISKNNAIFHLPEWQKLRKGCCPALALCEDKGRGTRCWREWRPSQSPWRANWPDVYARKTILYLLGPSGWSTN